MVVARQLSNTTPNPVIVKQLQRETRQKFELLTTSEFVLTKGPTRGRQYSTKPLKQKNEAKQDGLPQCKTAQVRVDPRSVHSDDNDRESQPAWVDYVQSETLGHIGL